MEKKLTSQKFTSEKHSNSFQIGNFALDQAYKKLHSLKKMLKTNSSLTKACIFTAFCGLILMCYRTLTRAEARTENNGLAKQGRLRN